MDQPGGNVESSPVDIDSQARIRLMVDSFYSHVRQDGLLGPIFEQAIEDWSAHLPKMYLFWEKLLFGTGAYEGNPFQKHVELPVEKEHFNRWVDLFVQTVDEHFLGPKAEEVKALARRIAATFQLRMGMTPDHPEHAVPNYTRAR
jgi:hemoglobin